VRERKSRESGGIGNSGVGQFHVGGKIRSRIQRQVGSPQLEKSYTWGCFELRQMQNLGVEVRGALKFCDTQRDEAQPWFHAVTSTSLH
jgi:hypothetical protein